jgi:hypothetical protein
MKVAQDSIRSERRRSPRNGHVIEGWLSPFESQERTELTTFDISSHGVSFDATAEIPVGAKYIYEIGFGKHSLVCDIRIVNCRPIANDIWHIGAEFI